VSQKPVTTDEIGRLISDFLALSKDAINESQDAGGDAFLDHISAEDASNLKLILDNGQIFTVRIIAGDR
jgi:hypothetical protein